MRVFTTLAIGRLRHKILSEFIAPTAFRGVSAAGSVRQGAARRDVIVSCRSPGLEPAPSMKKRI
jgi:hypothetical protein